MIRAVKWELFQTKEMMLNVKITHLVEKKIYCYCMWRPKHTLVTLRSLALMTHRRRQLWCCCTDSWNKYRPSVGGGGQRLRQCSGMLLVGLFHHWLLNKKRKDYTQLNTHPKTEDIFRLSVFTTADSSLWGWSPHPPWQQFVGLEPPHSTLLRPAASHWNCSSEPHQEHVSPSSTVSATLLKKQKYKSKGDGPRTGGGGVSSTGAKSKQSH